MTALQGSLNLPAVLASLSPNPGREQGAVVGIPQASTLLVHGHARGQVCTLQLHMGMRVVMCPHGSHRGMDCMAMAKGSPQYTALW